MITVGLDLASDPRNTAMAVVDWASRTPRVVSVEVGVDDELIVDTARHASRVGIDCPFGWPGDYIDFLVEQRAGRVRDPRRVATTSGRRELLLRVTDQWVREQVGLTPVSLAADKSGPAALRCAGLLARLEGVGKRIGRDGRGDVVEVYPTASLDVWGVHESGYKTKPGLRARMLQRLCPRIPLDLGGLQGLVTEDGDAFDALVSALTVRAVALGAWREPLPGPEQAAAETEGWICVPTGTIEVLQRGAVPPAGTP